MKPCEFHATACSGTLSKLRIEYRLLLKFAYLGPFYLPFKTHLPMTYFETRPTRQPKTSHCNEDLFSSGPERQPPYASLLHLWRHYQYCISHANDIRRYLSKLTPQTDKGLELDGKPNVKNRISKNTQWGKTLFLSP